MSDPKAKPPEEAEQKSEVTPEKDELTDQELDQVAGGGDGNETSPR